MKTSEICQDKRPRRRRIREYNVAGKVYGLDYVDVSEDQLTLTVYFLGKAPAHIKKENVRIEGGRRIRTIKISGFELRHTSKPEQDDFMVINVEHPGDFSRYTLHLVTREEDAHGNLVDTPFKGFDPGYARVDFSFKTGVPGDIDCLAEDTCPPPAFVEPEINYLAKDYASFRQLILDRLALIMPDWKERHLPDLGIALVEIFAYAGDYLSYYQDAVATEAYLATARQRISVRRHVRLVDYLMHEGCNARALVHVKMTGAPSLELKPNEVYFITGSNDALGVNSTELTPDDLGNVPASSYEVFEPLIEEPEQPMPLGLEDLKNAASLVNKLKESSDQDPLSRYLRGSLSPNLQHLLDSYDGSTPPSEQLTHSLIHELNRLIRGRSLYTQELFAQVTFTRETWRQIRLNRQHPERKETARLNRLLLEEAYPEELVNSRSIHLYKAHNRIEFYTWGDEQCCLPRGATSATLRDRWVQPPVSRPQETTPVEQKAQKSEPPPEPSKEHTSEEHPQGEVKRERKLHLKKGDILIFEEITGPKTGIRADADLSHRHAVRLTRVTPGIDELYDRPIVEIEWAAEDALPFPLCLSAIGPAPECRLLDHISVARGNVILVDHGETIAGEPLGCVEVQPSVPHCEDKGRASEIEAVPKRFHPHLQKAPLTFSQSLSTGVSATRLLAQEPRLATPEIELTGISTSDVTALAIARNKAWSANESGTAWLDSDRGDEWLPQRDLLGSHSLDYHFVAEMDNDGDAHLRFGDGELGRMPKAEMAFYATYRVGNGPSGNVGAEAISHIVFCNARYSDITLEPRNPLPARGGTPPEPLDEVKLYAPHAFHTDLQRAITADDYARLAERNPKVQRAAATLRWTGGWYEVVVAIDPLGEVKADKALLDEIRGYLHRYRRMGHDLLVVPATYVPLDIALEVTVLPHYLRGHVKAALLNLFSNRILANGELGFFHPDKLTFGEGIALSNLVAAAQAVQGVESVTVSTLKRRFEGPNYAKMKVEFLPLGPTEIARLDNDANFPENGNLVLTMRGGR